MKLLPFENYFLDSKLSADEIISRLQNQMEPRKYARFTFLKDQNSYKPYEGKIEANRFWINRIIRTRNAFLPMISGEIEKNGFGSRVRIKMRMMTIAIVFMI